MSPVEARWLVRAEHGSGAAAESGHAAGLNGCCTTARVANSVASTTGELPGVTTKSALRVEVGT